MGQVTYVKFGASASVVVDVSTLSRIRNVLRIINDEHLGDDVYIGEYRDDGSEITLHDYDEFRSWLESPDAAAFDMDAFNEAFGPTPRIVFMHIAKTFYGYGIQGMSNPYIYDEDTESIGNVVVNLEKGKALLAKLGFTEKEIKLGYTLREFW